MVVPEEGTGSSPVTVIRKPSASRLVGSTPVCSTDHVQGPPGSVVPTDMTASPCQTHVVSEGQRLSLRTPRNETSSIPFWMLATSPIRSWKTLPRAGRTPAAVGDGIGSCASCSGSVAQPAMAASRTPDASLNENRNFMSVSLEVRRPSPRRGDPRRLS